MWSPLPTTPRRAVCIVIYSALCIFFVSQNKAKKCYMVPSFTNIQPLMLYASKKQKRIPQQNPKKQKQKTKKTASLEILGRAPWTKPTKTQKNKKSPHGRSSYPHRLFFWCFLFLDIYPPILMVLFLCSFLAFGFLFLVCFLSYLLSPKKPKPVMLAQP